MIPNPDPRLGGAGGAAVAFALVLLLGLLPGCGSDDPVEPEAVTFQSVVASGGTYETVSYSEEQSPPQTQTQTDDDGTQWECEVIHYSMVDAPDNYHTFNPNADVIYPGALIQGKSLQQANPSPIVAARGGGTVVIDSANGDEVTSVDVDEVSLGSIRDAVNELVREHSGVLPARFTLDYNKVSSMEQLAFKLGVDVKTFTNDFKSNVSFSQERTYNRWYIKLTQQFYTVSFETPASLAAFFAPNVDPADLKPYIAKDNPAVYISSVTYGRAFYMLIESTSSHQEIEASIQNTYDMIVNVDVTAESNYVRELSDVKVHVFAMGGDSQSALGLMMGDIAALEDYIVNGGRVETGVQLSYALRNLLDHSNVGVKVATEYDVKNCYVVSIGERSSDFQNATVDGWSAVDGATDFKCDDTLDTGHGYYLFAKDGAGGAVWFFQAATKFRGNWSALYGGKLAYLLMVRYPSGVSWLGDYDDVRIYGPGNDYLSFRFSSAGFDRPGFHSFTSYEIDLSATPSRGQWKFKESGLPEVVATEADMRRIFEDVRELKLRGEYISGADWALLDEVVLSLPD